LSGGYPAFWGTFLAGNHPVPYVYYYYHHNIIHHRKCSSSSGGGGGGGRGIVDMLYVGIRKMEGSMVVNGLSTVWMDG